MIKSKIMKLYKSLAKKNKIYLFDYSKNSFFEGVYRLLALIISPLLIWLNPNIISILSLLSGFLGLILAVRSYTAIKI